MNLYVFFSNAPFVVFACFHYAYNKQNNPSWAIFAEDDLPDEWTVWSQPDPDGTPGRVRVDFTPEMMDQLGIVRLELKP